MKISPRDLVQLSAFLDGELSRKEMIQLEERLKENPDFQAVLEELKITKEILRITPRLRVPRNFSLSRAQLGMKTRQPVYRKYSLAAAVMSFVFIGILILDFGSIFLGGSFAPAMAPKSQEIMFDTTAESAVEEMEQPALMSANAEAETDAAPGEEGEVQVEELAEPAEEISERMTEEEMAPAAEPQAVRELAPTVVVESLGEAKTTSDHEAGDGDDLAEQTDGLIQTYQAAPSPELLPQATLAVTYADESTSWGIQQSRITPLRILEIILGLAIIVFGAAAWVLRRRDSR